MGNFHAAQLMVLCSNIIPGRHKYRIREPRTHFTGPAAYEYSYLLVLLALMAFCWLGTLLDLFDDGGISDSKIANHGQQVALHHVCVIIAGFLVDSATL